MKIIILGAGQVGGSLAEILAGESHDITLVDQDAVKLRHFQDQLDIRTVHGCASYPDVLEDAGGDSADMLIAVTSSDEVNMVACQVAYSLFNTPKKIARIRSPHYFLRPELFGKENLPIDVFISPEKLITESIASIMAHPGAQQVLNFANGKVKLVSIRAEYGSPILGRSIKAFYSMVSDHPCQVVGLYRHYQSISVHKNTEIEQGDEVYFVAEADQVSSIIQALTRNDTPHKRMMIAGGSHIGKRLAQTIEHDYHTKIVEPDKLTCEALSHQLSEALVLCGDSCDKNLLINENIEHTDVFCALTNDDEDNIIACLQAKRLGASMVMSLVTRGTYLDLIDGGVIDIAISPQEATIGSLLTHIRQGDVVNVHALRRIQAEAIEMVAHGELQTSNIVGRAIKDLPVIEGAVIAAIVRQDAVIIPSSTVVVDEGDHVILFCTKKRAIHEVEKLFQVSVGFF